MNCQKVNINEHHVVTSETITSFSISVNSVELFKSVRLCIYLFDANDAVIKFFILQLEGDDYNNWGGDDNYLYQCVAQKMGYTLSTTTKDDPVVPDEPVVPVIDEPVVPVIDEPVVPVIDEPVVPVIDEPVVPVIDV